jgi:hypothetical protein
MAFRMVPVQNNTSFIHLYLGDIQCLVWAGRYCRRIAFSKVGDSVGFPKVTIISWWVKATTSLILAVSSLFGYVR